uniref:Transposase n=1 Tax=Candidatus Kentrum sp. SD TaxID=2126332 RepID=A0A451BIM7_9GAMM|nr:MAG: Transposase [Candidatus Kentron sp. SD]
MQRAREAKELKARDIEPVLMKSRWVFLKRPDKLTEKQGSKLAEFLKHNLKTVKSYLLKVPTFPDLRISLLGRKTIFLAYDVFVAHGVNNP